MGKKIDPKIDPRETRCATYARSATNIKSSVERPIRKCEEYASRHGWMIVGNYSDNVASGATVAGRTGLQSLLRDATKPQPPFGRILTTDISRLARKLSDLLQLRDTLHANGIDIYFVAENFNSTDPMFRQFASLASWKLRDPQF